MTDHPPMVRPRPGDLGDLPIRTGAERTLGLKVRGKDNAFYFLAARGGLRRYARRFPLTEEGWRAAWAAFAAEDPAAAAGYLGSRHGEPAARVASPATDADVSEGWAYILGGCAVVTLAVVLYYVGVAELAAWLKVVGVVGALLGFAVMMIGAVSEGIRLARNT